MPSKQFVSRNIAILLVFGRPPLVFGGMICAIATMLTLSPWYYTLGLCLLWTAMTFDLIDGWFSARFRPHSKLAHLADRIMDKLVYSIVFPLIAFGMMWRYHLLLPNEDRPELLHAIFVLLLCITVLVRDHFAHFMRNFALKKGLEEISSEVNRLRTIAAAPIGAVLYAYAFYIPNTKEHMLTGVFDWFGSLPLRVLFFAEILFLVINLGSIASYCKKYGTYCLDELCMGDRILRHRILAFFPNALTVMNALMGILAVFFTHQQRVHEAYLILIGAALFDKLDGTVARRLGLTQTPYTPKKPKRFVVTFGGILDDIADMVSFCIVPAVMFYIVLTSFEHFEISETIIIGLAVAYALSGIARLIYFTLDRHPIPGFFKGCPTPAAALFAAAPLTILSHQLTIKQELLEVHWAYAVCGLMLMASILMNTYPIRYLHFGRLMGRHPWFSWLTVGICVTFFFTPYFGYAALVYLSLYLLSPLVTWRIRPEVAAQETRTPAKVS